MSAKRLLFARHQSWYQQGSEKDAAVDAAAAAFLSVCISGLKGNIQKAKDPKSAMGKSAFAR